MFLWFLLLPAPLTQTLYNMELCDIPVVFNDTASIDDIGDLGQGKSKKAYRF